MNSIKVAVLPELTKFILVFLFSISMLALTGCNDKLGTLADKIPDAENLLFTSDGRLFITASEHVYEYTNAKGAELVLHTANAEFLGMAQVGNYLYVVRSTMRVKPFQQLDIANLLQQGLAQYLFNTFSDLIMNKELLRADLTQTSLNFLPVYTLKNMFLPNGMAADSSGNLYIADETFLSIGQIVKVTISGNNFSQETWLSTSNGVCSPNGMSIRDNTLYFTDFKMSTLKAMVKKVDIINGRPGSVSTLYSQTGLFDDLEAGNYKGVDGIVVANFAKGSLLLLDKNGKLVSEILKGELDFPSSVRIGKGSMFNSDDLIITEKGILMEKESNIGNKVSLLQGN